MKTLKDIPSFFGLVRKKDIVAEFEETIKKVDTVGSMSIIKVSKNKQMFLEEFLYHFPDIDKTPIEMEMSGKGMGIN